MDTTLKNILKQSATEIRTDKALIRQILKGLVPGSSGALRSGLSGKKWEYRHKHIAYSMMRGRTYEQIEQKCAPDNKPNLDLVERIIDEYAKKDVCACA